MSMFEALKGAGLVKEEDRPDEPEQKTQQAVRPEGDGIVRISRQTKGRKGKGVTLINGLLLTEEELKALAKELKQHCGVGGAVKSGVIEIQGDQRDSLLAVLKDKGFNAKLAGG